MKPITPASIQLILTKCSYTHYEQYEQAIDLEWDWEDSWAWNEDIVHNVIDLLEFPKLD